MLDARLEVVHQAELMMEAASATRNYTSNDIKPLLDTGSSPDAEFRPETVPAFGATSVFQYLRKGTTASTHTVSPLWTPPTPQIARWIGKRTSSAPSAITRGWTGLSASATRLPAGCST